MAKGAHKQYPRFQADTDILSHVEFIEAFARRDERLGVDVLNGFVPISFPRLLEIAVEQNRKAIPEGHKTDFLVRGRSILESAIIEQGAIAGAQWMADLLLENGTLSKDKWQEAVDNIAVDFDVILFKYAEQSAFFLKDLQQTIARISARGRPQ